MTGIRQFRKVLTVAPGQGRTLPGARLGPKSGALLAAPRRCYRAPDIAQAETKKEFETPEWSHHGGGWVGPILPAGDIELIELVLGPDQAFRPFGQSCRCSSWHPQLSCTANPFSISPTWDVPIPQG